MRTSPPKHGRTVIAPGVVRTVPNGKRKTNRGRFRSRQRAGVTQRRGLDRPMLSSAIPGLAGPPCGVPRLALGYYRSPLPGLPNRPQHLTSNAKGEDETNYAAFVFAIVLT